jgi:hypothetical protein
LAHLPRALQIHSLDWALPSVLYGSGTDWYAGRDQLQQVFPVDSPPKAPADAPLSVLLTEVLGHGPLVPFSDESRAHQTAVSYAFASTVRSMASLEVSRCAAP